MYMHPCATTDSTHLTMLTVSNGHTSSCSMDYSNDHIKGYATHSKAIANGHWKEKEKENLVVMICCPNPLEYPFITVKAVQVVCPCYLFL
jgi:hypothetical protein